LYSYPWDSGKREKDYLLINQGDEVTFYWYDGDNQSNIAFAVYYSDTLPNPGFHPESYEIDFSKLLLYKRYGNLANTKPWELLGSFIVP